MQRIHHFEAEQDALVYLIIRSFTRYGTLDAYLFVKDNEEDWEDERQELQEGTALVYVYNQQDPIFSEFGCIGFERTVAGGLLQMT